jgi:hypothetical protein
VYGALLARERGQGTVEWIGIVLLVLMLLLGLLSALGAVPATGLARTIAARLICAAGLDDSCAIEPDLVDAYGPELAAEVADHAPVIVYESGMSALPVDFRSCRGSRCGNAPESGEVMASYTGERVAAFVHAIDCRTELSRAQCAARGLDCSGERAGNLYLQYWLYYEDSTSLRDLPGRIGFHQDDWESYQVRIGRGAAEARASSHHGYNYDGGIGSWASDAGVIHRSAWGPAAGRTYVSGGSHAGHVHENGRLTRRGRIAQPPKPRWTPADRLVLIPIETLDSRSRRTRFAVSPPWRKPVYRDPENEGT